MSEVVIADTGPLVAFLVRQAQHHRWACEMMASFRPPLLTGEPVLAEAAHLLRRHGCETDPLLALIERGVLNIAFSVESELAPLRQLMRRCRDQPMSLADACLVRLAELHDTPRVWTLDSDFRVYRRLGRLVIPTLMPDAV
ncbi:MAG TPA: PIN domain-containing protein [Verrucomicrobiota bacterium]|nr:PIN domain-containing protein [Verrucomicrobiota bacterium]